MSKVVLVISFDEPENEDAFKATVGQAIDALGPTMMNVANRHVWMGIQEKADEVLHLIGVPNG